jgi:hypothetical protein
MESDLQKPYQDWLYEVIEYLSQDAEKEKHRETDEEINR